MSVATASTRQRQAVHFDSKVLLVPVLVCLWMLPITAFSEGDGGGASRSGAVSILPPVAMKAMRFLGRGGAIGVLSFSLLSVWKYEKRRYAMAGMIPFLAFAFLGLVSTSWSPLKGVSFRQSVSFMLLMMLASYLSIAWRTDRDTERVVKHLGLSLFMLSFVMVLLRLVAPGSEALSRSATGVLHATNAGAAGGLCIVLTLSARMLWQSAWSRWWPAIVSLEIVMMFLGGNRLSIVVTTAAVMVLLGLRLHRAYAALAILLVATVLSGYVVLDPNLAAAEPVLKTIGVVAKQGQTTSDIGNLSGRAEMWEKMWKSYLDAPVFGHGYFVTTARGRINVWHEWGNWTAHNVLLQTLATVGAVGLTLLLMGFAVLAHGVRTGLHELDQIDGSVVLLLVLACWYLGWGLLNSSFVGPLQPESVVFAMGVGVAAGIGGVAKWKREIPSATLGSQLAVCR